MDRVSDKIKLKGDWVKSGNKYVAKLQNSDEFANIFSSISSLEGVTAKEGSKATNEETSFEFTDGKLLYTLQANYDRDVYSITVENDGISEQLVEIFELENYD